MKKLTKKEIKRLSSVVAIVAMLSLAVGSAALMFSGNNDGMVCEAGSKCTFQEAQEVAPENDNFGALVSPYIYTPLYANGGLTVVGDISNGSVDERWISGSCTDATTTPLGIVNPFGEDVTIDRMELYIQNGTSTVEITVGTSSVGVGLSADPSDLLFDDLAMASSTAGTATTTLLSYNTSATVSGTSGFKDPGTNSEDAIRWKTGEYVAMYVDTLYSGALTEATNIFSCTYKIHTVR